MQGCRGHRNVWNKTHNLICKTQFLIISSPDYIITSYTGKLAQYISKSAIHCTISYCLIHCTRWPYWSRHTFQLCCTEEGFAEHSSLILLCTYPLHTITASNRSVVDLLWSRPSLEVTSQANPFHPPFTSTGVTEATEVPNLVEERNTPINTFFFKDSDWCLSSKWMNQQHSVLCIGGY